MYSQDHFYVLLRKSETRIRVRGWWLITSIILTMVVSNRPLFASSEASAMTLANTRYVTPSDEVAAKGRVMFMKKCWGCHHEEAAAFGPSLRWIGLNRSEEQVRAQIASPSTVALTLGYKRSAMPVIPMMPEEVDLIVDYIRLAGKRHVQAQQ